MALYNPYAVQRAAGTYKNSRSGVRNEIRPTIGTTPTNKYTSTAIPTGNAGYGVSTVNKAAPAISTKPKTTSTVKSASAAAPAATRNTGFTSQTVNATGSKVSDRGLQTRNDSPAWYTDEWDRQRQNAQVLANAGIQYELKPDPYSGLPAINYALGQNIGEIEGDPTGGMYDYSGMSNNPNFLRATIGLTRDQVNANPVLAGLSDKALATIYGLDQTYGNDLYYNPGDGFNISSFKGANGVSVGDVRKALAELTGQKDTYAEDLGGWWGGTLAPFAKANYYDNNANLGARQQTEIIDPFVAQIMAGLTSGGSSGSVAAGPSVGAAVPSQAAGTSKPAEYDDDELRKYILQNLTGRLR